MRKWVSYYITMIYIIIFCSHVCKLNKFVGLLFLLLLWLVADSCFDFLECLMELLLQRQAKIVKWQRERWVQKRTYMGKR